MSIGLVVRMLCRPAGLFSRGPGQQAAHWCFEADWSYQTKLTAQAKQPGGLLGPQLLLGPPSSLPGAFLAAAGPVGGKHQRCCLWPLRGRGI